MKKRGTWYVVRGTWYVVRGTRYVVLARSSAPLVSIVRAKTRGSGSTRTYDVSVESHPLRHDFGQRDQCSCSEAGAPFGEPGVGRIGSCRSGNV
jgi:hypothetical protein